MMCNEMVSIIIPAYNCENKILDLLDTLKKQTYSNFEILIVNDGSDDNTQEICEKYCMKDRRFKIFSKKNAGVSSARNYGLRNVTGQYVIFIDADDNICTTYLEHLIYSKDKADLVIGTLISMLPDGKVDSVDDILEKNSVDILLNHWSACNKLFRYEDIKNIRFDENVRIAEDLKFICDYLCKNNPSVYYCREAEYFYIMNEKSAMKSEYNSNFLKGFETEIMCYAKLANNSFQIENTPIIANGAYQVFTRFFTLSLKEQKKLRNDFRVAKEWCMEYKSIIRTSKIEKKKRIIIYLSVRMPIVVIVYKMLKKYVYLYKLISG